MKTKKASILVVIALLCGCQIPAPPLSAVGEGYTPTHKNIERATVVSDPSLTMQDQEKIKNAMAELKPLPEAKSDAGVITVSKGSASPSGTITASANTYLGQWDLSAGAGENEKVSRLRFRAVINTFITEKTLKNVKLLLNGRQIGTTIPFMKSSAVQSITSNVADVNDVTFNVGNSLIVAMGGTKSVFVAADATDLYAGNTVQVALVSESDNVEGQISSASANAPAATIAGNVITIE